MSGCNTICLLSQTITEGWDLAITRHMPKDGTMTNGTILTIVQCHPLLQVKLQRMLLIFFFISVEQLLKLFIKLSFWVAITTRSYLKIPYENGFFIYNDQTYGGTIAAIILQEEVEHIAYLLPNLSHVFSSISQ